MAKAKPTWADVKAKLAGANPKDFINLVRDMYEATKDNQVFLHARFGLVDDPLATYKATIDRWMWPDAFSRENPSVAKAKQAISAYKKAVGDARGLAELMVFFCEQGAGFCADLGYQEDSYFNALCLIFQQALKVIAGLPQEEQDEFLTRLHVVRDTSQRFGYGVEDFMDGQLAGYEDRSKRKVGK